MDGNLRSKIMVLIRKNLFRSIKYSISGYIGFFILEGVTYILLREYGYTHLIWIDALAFFLGVAAEFLINEYWTTRNEGYHSTSIQGHIWRLFKFEFLNLLGNGIAIAVQLSLLHFFDLYPLIGNIIGSGIAFPFNYAVQMKSVWKIDISS